MPDTQTKDHMKSITSISGGKSSAYMAVHFPTDHHVFAIVLTDQVEVAPKDAGLLSECQKRIPGFIASRELDQTLVNVLRLEELLGKEIKWVAAADDRGTPLTYDALIGEHHSLPNQRTRFCTEELKLYPIFWHCYLNLMDDPQDVLWMHIGFRADEMVRVEKMQSTCQTMQFPDRCLIGAKHKRNKQKHRAIEWRVPGFPMAEHGINQLEVAKFWLDKGWQFPIVSNCDGCFWHTPQQLRLQADLHPERIQWWVDKEAELGSTWVKGSTYDRVISTTDIPIPTFNAAAGCFCHD